MMVILYIIVIIIFFFFAKNNYKKRTELINKNIEEFIIDILSNYNLLNVDNQNKLILSLDNNEKYYFDSIINNNFPYSSNMNIVQSYMLHLQQIMDKIKILSHNQNKL